MKKEEELLSVAKEELESKSQEVQKEKDEDSETKCAAAMSELFLKQVLNQGSKKFDLYRRNCVDEKKMLFEQLDVKKKNRIAMKKDIKAARKNTKVLQDTLAEKNVKIAKEKASKEKKQKGFLTLKRELKECQEKNSKMLLDLKTSKESMEDIQADIGEMKEDLQHLEKLKAFKRSWKGRILSFFCIKINV